MSVFQELGFLEVLNEPIIKKSKSLSAHVMQSKSMKLNSKSSLKNTK